MSTKTADRSSARDRLLAAADELFYAEGVHAVGIDRVIERAGVAKASLYNVFGSKDELVKAYLTQRRVGIFDIVGRSAAAPGYRGCAFMKASAESLPGGGVEEVCDDTRAWIRGLFRELAAEAGAADPANLAAQFVVLYDGAVTGAQMDRNPSSVAVARSMAAALLDAAVWAPSR
jgi:AcrR family transcriptional regulator